MYLARSTLPLPKYIDLTHLPREVASYSIVAQKLSTPSRRATLPVIEVPFRGDIRIDTKSISVLVYVKLLMQAIYP